MSPRFGGGPPPGPRGPGGVRMPQQVDFNAGGPPGPMMGPGSMDPSRQGMFCYETVMKRIYFLLQW